MSQPGWPPSNNPYESPKQVVEETASYNAGPWEMDYFGGFRVIQSNPNWFVNSLIVGLVFLLIPIVGFIAVLGYGYETAELLHRTNGKIYWDFNFNRFGDYLARGIAPFLIYLLFGILLGVAGLFIQQYIGTVFNVPLGFNPFNPAQQPFKESDLVPFIQAHIAATIIQNALQGLFAFIYYPMGIRGGLMRNISGAFDFAHGLDMLSRIWLEMLIVFLLNGLFMIGVVFIGYGTCCLGFFPLQGYMTLLNGWFTYQLYRKYLSLGGQPIPLKPMPGLVQQ